MFHFRSIIAINRVINCGDICKLTLASEWSVSEFGGVNEHEKRRRVLNQLGEGEQKVAKALSVAERDHQPIGHSRYKFQGESLKGSILKSMLMRRKGKIHRVQRCPRSRLKARADISFFDDKTSDSFFSSRKRKDRTGRYEWMEKVDEKYFVSGKCKSLSLTNSVVRKRRKMNEIFRFCCIRTNFDARKWIISCVSRTW